MSLYNANNICLSNVLKVSLIFNSLLALSFYILIQYQYLFNCILGTHCRSQFFYSCGRNSPIWTVTQGAKSAGERPRTNQLATHRNPVREFQPARQIETIIPGPALSASASERLQTLATPKNRSEGPFRDPKWPV